MKNAKRAGGETSLKSQVIFSLDFWWLWESIQSNVNQKIFVCHQ